MATRGSTSTGDRPPSPASTLDPDVIAQSDSETGIGHGIDALGPSDTSDSGSDIHGAPGLSHEVGIEGLGTGTTSDPEDSTADFTAGPDIGDANMDSDSDAAGTGETATAARDTVVPDGRDISPDHIEYLGDVLNPDGDQDVTDDANSPPPRHKRH
jgi:hypothetical protein